MNQLEPQRLATLRAFPRVAGALVALVGGAVLIGWVLDISLLKSPHPSLVTMKANTALGMVLAGVSLLLLRPAGPSRARSGVGQACALAAAALGMLTLAEYAAGWDLGIDQALFRDMPGSVGTSHPGRMAVATALDLALMGVALAALHAERLPRLGQAMAVTALLIAFLGAVGYILDAQPLYTIAPFSSVAIHTALAFLLLALGALAAGPLRGPLALAVSDQPGGAMARRLMPAVVIVPLGLGWLRLVGQRAGLYEMQFGLSLLVVAIIVGLAALVALNARSLDRLGAERDRAARAMRRSEAALRALLEATPDAIVVTAADGRITYVNATAEQMLGWARSELVGRPLEVLVPGPLRVSHADHRQQYQGDPQPRPMASGLDLHVRRRDGSEFPAEIGLSPIESPEGRLIVSAIRDLTLARQAEAVIVRQQRAAHEQARRLALLAELTRAMTSAREREAVFSAIPRVAVSLLGARVAHVWLADPERGVLRARGSFGVDAGVERDLLDATEIQEGQGLPGRIFQARAPEFIADASGDPRWINSRFIEGLGLRAYAGLPLVVGDHPVGVLSILFGERRDFSAEDREVMGLLAGHAAIALENARLFDEQATTAAENARLYAEAQRALAELSQAQEQLVQSQKMEAVGRLAAGIAHDFNNLLTVIIGRAGLLAEAVAPALRHGVEQIRLTAERAATLTRQLLAFSRKQVLQPRVLDLEEVVAGLAPMLGRLLGEDIRVMVEPGAGGVRIRADQGQIEQVIVNLAVNARDAMPDGGSLTLRTLTLDLDEAAAARRSEATPGAYAGVAVSDTGVGMSPEVQARMFEPFFTTKGVGKGTGLGLSMVYGIVRQHDGFVEVESARGRGTTISVWLPRAGAPMPASAEAADAPGRPPRGSETILLVEDEAEVRALAREVLQDLGYRVLTAASAAEALEIVGRGPGPIDLLLTDVVMPEMGGPDLAERIGARHPGTRILYMSGYTDDVLLRQRIVGGEHAFIAKPFTPAQIARSVRECLDARG